MLHNFIAGYNETTSGNLTGRPGSPGLPGMPARPIGPACPSAPFAPEEPDSPCSNKNCTQYNKSITTYLPNKILYLI